MTLGTVGGRIVAETLIGLLWADGHSYLRQSPNWEPKEIRNMGDLIAFGLASLFVLAALVAFAVITASVARALPQVRAVKAALANCPETRELRFTVRELVVTPARGNVVALPVRLKPAALQPLRAAA